MCYASKNYIMNQMNKLNRYFTFYRKMWCINLIKLSIVFVIGISIFGCSNDTDPIIEDEYYVKYEVKSSTIYIGGKLNVTINTETNETVTIEVNQRESWEAIVGPVTKGFESSMYVAAKGETHNQLKLFANIYVNKNDGPFALKEFDDRSFQRNSLDLSYRINF